MVLNRTLFTILICSCFFGVLSGQIFPMNGTPINACTGFFTDSGGLNGQYQNNQNFTSVICADGSGNSHVKLEMQDVFVSPGDSLCFYDDDFANPDRYLTCNWEFFSGDDFNIQATAANTTGCITVVFKSNTRTVSDGWVAEISCVRECQRIVAEIASATPAVSPADTGWIDLCPLESVSFSGKGAYPQSGLHYNHSDLTSEFRWDFGDGTFASGQDVTKVYDKPGGYNVSLTIMDQTGCVNSNHIKQRVRIAPPPTFNIGTGLDKNLCAGDTLNLSSGIRGINPGLDISAQANEESFDKGGIRSDSLALPDGTGTSYETSIEITDFRPGQTLDNIQDLLGICVNIEHSWMRDMQIIIRCPNGTEVELHNHPGNNGGMVYLGEPVDLDGTNPVPGVGYEYCWTPTATRGTWITYANNTFGFFGSGTLPAGDYTSYSGLDKLIGCPLNGKWTIRVTDLWKEDNGFIFSWSLNFAEHLYPTLESFTPEILSGDWINNSTFLNETTNLLTASPVNAGNVDYTYQVTDEFGCIWDTLINIAILPPTHADCYNCKKFTQPLSDIEVCEGEQVQLDASPLKNEDFPVRFEAFPNALVGHDYYPPANPFEAAINVNSVNPDILDRPGNQIESICFDLETDYASDIQVSVEGPNNQRLLLTRNNGTTGSYRQTCFTPSSITPIASANAPFSGDYKPQGNWEDLSGENINGNWKLLVSDAAGFGEFGTLNSWSIAFINQVDITYTWSNPGVLSCSDCPNPTADISEKTIIELETVDNFGCKFSDKTEIDLFSAPAPVISCESNDSGQIELTWDDNPDIDRFEINIDNQGWTTVAGNSFSYGNFNSGDFSTIQIRAFYDGVECYSKTDQSTCQFVKCEIESNYTTTPPTCNNENDGSITIEPELGFGTYRFSIDGVNYISTNQFTDLPEGDYTAYVTDDLGCADTVDFEIAAPLQFTVDVEVVNNVSCFGGNDGELRALPSGGTPPYRYLWNDPLSQIGQTATQLTAGFYEVTVIDASGCMDINNSQITQPTDLVFSVSQTDIKCFGDSTGTATVNISGGTPPYNVTWDTLGQTAMTAVNLPAGAYFVIVADANQCSKTEIFTIEQPIAPLTLTVEQTLEGCADAAENEARVNPFGGTGVNFSYLWSDGQTDRDATNLPEGTYTVEVTDENGCKTKDTIEIESLEPIEVILARVEPTCNGRADGKISASNATGGTGVFSPSDFLWSTGERGGIIENLEGDQTYSVTVYDSRGCEGSIDFYLSQPDSILLDIAFEHVTCYGGNDGTATVRGLLGQNPSSIQSYAWGSKTGNQTTPTASNLSEGQYLVTITDNGGCEGYGQVLIEQPTEIKIEPMVIDNECFGDNKGSIEVKISGGTPDIEPDRYAVAWSNGDFGNRTENLYAGVYSLSVTDALDCEMTEGIEVGEADPINASITTSDVKCHGDRNGEIKIDATGGAAPFQYSIGDDFFTGSSTLIGLHAGEYDLVIRDRKECLFFEKVIIEQPAEFVVDAGPPLIEIKLGDSVSLIASSNNIGGTVDFEWESPYSGLLSCDFCQTTTVHPQNTVFLSLYGEDENGCNDTDQIEIRVLKDRKVFVPTGFTPNQDGVNDRLLIHGESGTNIKIFRVFDRWGELIFEAQDFDINDPNIGWNGQFRSKYVNSGIYTWYLEVEYSDAATDVFRGETTLIR